MNPLSERLRNRREELTLSVKEISSRTRIRPNVINALEEGNFDILPRVYITSFVKNYGSLLGISDEELDELWIASGLDIPKHEASNFSLSNVLQSNKETATTPTTTYISGNTIKPKTKIKPVQASPKVINLLIYSALLLGISAIGYYYFFREIPKPPRQAGELVPASEIRDSSSEGGLLNTLFNEPTKDSIILEATATDSVWLTMNADGKKSDQLLMTPGMQRRWSAKSQFVLSLGNAGALDLKRNNIPLPQLGNKGTALRYVKITENEVNTSASPYKNIDSLSKIAALAAEKKAAAEKKNQTITQDQHQHSTKHEKVIPKTPSQKSAAKINQSASNSNVANRSNKSQNKEQSSHKLILKHRNKENKRQIEKKQRQSIPITPAAPIQSPFKR
jgi:transcriptional regulator with XRE-family HTH domain